jgi:hypothetical protein
MLGFLFWLRLIHEDDDNYLTFLKLSYPYSKTGVYRSGKSIIIKSHTKWGCYKYLDRLVESECIIHDGKPKDFPVYGEPILILKNTYVYYLELYISSELGYNSDVLNTLKYITRTSKKIAYLEAEVKKLFPDYKNIEDILYPDFIMR